MDFEIVVPDKDEFPGPMTPTFTAFAMNDISDEVLGDERLQWDVMRPLCARRGDEWLAGASDYAFDVTLPGGAILPAAGVTMVGVHPTQRRRGLLRALMERQLDDVAERGEPLAVLTASETSIYGRFGYGQATAAVGIQLETDRSAFTSEPSAPGRCRLVADKVEGSNLARAVYDEYCRWRPGSVSRIDWMWEFQRRDRERWRDGAGATFWLLHEDAGGRPDGYATYRIRERWDQGFPASTAVVDDLFSTDPEVEAALWRFVLDLDLVTSVECVLRPVDDPLRWRLVEPRRVRTNRLQDWLWARVLDVPAVLAARSYAVEGALVLDVVDRFRPASGGRFRLEGGPDGATCVPTTAGADLTLGAPELGALVFGGVTASTLAGAGRVDVHDDAARSRADLMFTSTRAPYCNTHF